MLQTAKKGICLFNKTVCILPSFGKASTGTAADREIEVSAYVTSVPISAFVRAVTVKGERSDTSEKEVYTLFTSEHIRPFVNTVTHRTKMKGDGENAQTALSGQK